MAEEDVLRRVSVEGRTYAWTGKKWVDVESFTNPPAVTINKLNAILLSRLNEEDEKITDFDQLLSRAKDAKAQTQYGRAIGLTRRALQLSPGNLWAVAVLCSCLRALGKPEEALRESEPYKNEVFLPIITTRSAALCDLERWEEARININRVFSIQRKRELWQYPQAFRILNRIKAAKPELFKRK
jgi:tetratricopeptide (TPR) repeat protein